MKCIKVKKTDLVDKVRDDTFIYCPETKQGFIKKDLSSLELDGEMSFENVTDAIEAMDLEDMENAGLDSISFENGKTESSTKLDKSMLKMVEDLKDENTTEDVKKIIDEKIKKRKFFHHESIITSFESLKEFHKVLTSRFDFGRFSKSSSNSKKSRMSYMRHFNRRLNHSLNVSIGNYFTEEKNNNITIPFKIFSSDTIIEAFCDKQGEKVTVNKNDILFEPSKDFIGHTSIKVITKNKYKKMMKRIHIELIEKENNPTQPTPPSVPETPVIKPKKPTLTVGKIHSFDLNDSDSITIPFTYENFNGRTIEIHTKSLNGKTQNTATNFTFIPERGFIGEATMELIISDDSKKIIEEITINVSKKIIPIIEEVYLASIVEDTNLTFTMKDLLTNINFPLDDAKIDSLKSKKGKITLDKDTYTFKPYKNKEGEVDVKFIVDVNGEKVEGLAKFVIIGVNDAPAIWGALSISVRNSDRPYKFNVTVTDPDKFDKANLVLASADYGKVTYSLDYFSSRRLGANIYNIIYTPPKRDNSKPLRKDIIHLKAEDKLGTFIRKSITVWL